MDLGDRRHKYCVLNESGKVVKTGDIANSRGQLEAIARSYAGSRVVLECGTHSPWVSRYLEGLGMRVIVANARKTRAISENERKSDERDAELLARLGRVDPALLHPVVHGSEQAQHDMLQIKLRDALVRNRASLINAVRFTLKSLGYAVSNPSSASFHKTVGSEIPASCRVLIAPILAALEELSVRIKELETSIAQMARQRYPQAQKLQQIAGVGPITSIYFVLKIGEPARFARNRDVGAFRGCVPEETRVETPIRNCASPNAEIAICDGSWSMPPNTFWDPSERPVRCATMDCALQRRRAEQPAPKNALLSPWRANSLS